MSVVFLKKQLYRHHWTAIFCIVLGCAMIGVVTIKSGKAEGTAGAQAFGILLLILSQFFHGTMFISEEFLFRGYYMEPFFAVGTEGMWGNSIYLILLPIMQKLKCGDQTDPQGLELMCNYGYLENSSFMFYQMSQNYWIIFTCFLTIFVVAGYNALGISVTKYASAANRSTIDTGRTVSIWIFSLLLGLEKFNAWQLPGFVILTFGTLLYNEILVLTCCGFNQYTKDALAKEEGLDERASIKIKNEGYTSSGSPGKAYDSRRRDRSITQKHLENADQTTRNSYSAAMQL